MPPHDAMPLNSHTEEQRVFIVRRLAVFDPPNEIIEAFRARWKDTNCDAEDIDANNPRRVQLPEIMLAIFNARRSEFMENFALAAPTAEKSVRLVELHSMYLQARNRNAIALAAEILAQIAEEQGSVDAGNAPDDAPEFKAVEVVRTVVDPAAPTVAA
jgi:hypothetical protein